jgi:hypothetical protein
MVGFFMAFEDRPRALLLAAIDASLLIATATKA